MSDPHEFRGFGHDPFPATPSKGEGAEPVVCIRQADLDLMRSTGRPVFAQIQAGKTNSFNVALFASPTSRGEGRSFAASIEAQALKEFAEQRLPDEMAEEARDYADFEGAYIIMVKKARDALSALSKARSAGTQHEREKVIEECAVVAERRPPGVDGASIAKSIRSLKTPNAGEPV